jgi:hypothetical protein
MKTSNNNKVMVLSTNATFTNDVKCALNQNFDVLEVHNTQDALDALLPEQVQVVVVDQMLDQTTGESFLSTLRLQFPQVKSVFVVQNSADLNWESLVNNANPFRVVSVPVNLTTLVKHVTDAANQYNKEFECEQNLEQLNRQNQQMQFLLTQSLLS